MRRLIAEPPTMKKIALALLCALPCFGYTQNYVDRYLTDSLTYVVIGNSSDLVNAPRDLDVKPNTNEVWVANYGTMQGANFIIFYNAGLSSQSSEYRKDTHSSHFVCYTSAFAFSDIGEFATIGEMQNMNPGSTFMGPSLWSQDTNIFSRVFQNNWVNGLPLGSHLDMLHQSPYGMGIAHDTAKAYWVFDGYNNNLCKYDFVMGHGPGYEDHSAGMIWRYTDVSLTRVVGVPSHMCVDTMSDWLYFIDGGPKQLKRLNKTTGTVAGNLTPASTSPESLAGYFDVQGATVEVIDSFVTQPCGLEIYNGRLLVGDYTNGNIYVYDITGPTPVFMDTLVTGQAGMMGIKIGPDGNIWFVNNTASTLVRIETTLAADDAAILEITSPLIENFEGMMPDFYSIKFTTCSGNITPSVTLYNAGSNLLTSAVIEYSIDGNTPVSYNWTGSVASGNSLSVSLSSSTLTDGWHHIRATISMPNGVSDINASNDAKAGSFRTMGTIASVPFFEGFTNPVLEPAGWSHEGYNPNCTMLWDSAGGFGLSTGCVKMDNFSGAENINGQVDYFRMPAVDMTNAPTGTVFQFNMAYAKYDAASMDRLQVRVSTDCGTTWTTVYNKAGTPLSTTPISASEFTPTASQWRQESINLNAYIGQPEVRFMFVYTSNWGNNVFIDDVNILNTTGVEEPTGDFAMNVYPNPASDAITVDFGNEPGNPETQLHVFDVLGNEVHTATANGAQQIAINTSEWANGMYFIRATRGTSVVTRELVIAH